MAASSTIINSTDVVIQITEDSGSSYDTVGFCTSCSLSWSMSERDVTTKDSSGRKEILPGKSEWSVDFEGGVTYSTATDVDKPNNIYTLADAKTSVGIRYGRLTTGEIVYTGNGYFTSYSQDAGVEDNNTFSVSFMGTSTLTQAAYS